MSLLEALGVHHAYCQGRAFGPGGKQNRRLLGRGPARAESPGDEAVTVDELAVVGVHDPARALFELAAGRG